jgi:cytochrome c oxidase subunit II
MSSSPRTRPAPGTIVAGLVVVGVLLLIALAVAGGTDIAQVARNAIASMFPPAAATEQGDEISSLYTIVFVFAAIIFLVVEGLIIWTVIRYRRKPGDDELPPQTHGNNLAEIAWTVIPTLIVAFLFVISWQTLDKVDTTTAAAPGDVQVRAVASQFSWQFEYLAEDGQTVVARQVLAQGPGGGLVLPVGRTVHLSLKSNDVIHAFYVPRFLYKRDVNPDGENQFEFRLKADEAGQTYTGQCAELCGAGHRTMTFEVHAVTGAEYDTWLADLIEQANATPPPQGSGPPPAETLTISAQGLQFSTDALTAPADQPFAIDFDNQAAGVPHDVAIQDAGGLRFNGEDVTGPKKILYNIEPLAAGQYTFLCTIHPAMTGTLTVE